jgi:hypothetical protein
MVKKRLFLYLLRIEKERFSRRFFTAGVAAL